MCRILFIDRSFNVGVVGFSHQGDVTRTRDSTQPTGRNPTGAGIVVRNSIILVDFIELRLKEGMPLEEAVIDAVAVRFRPMLLTAAAVIVGSAIILTDPIFQGLAISLMAGEIASLLLSRSAVPILYYKVWRKHYERSPKPSLDLPLLKSGELETLDRV